MQTCACCPEAILSLPYKSGYRCSCIAVHKFGCCRHLTIISDCKKQNNRGTYCSELLTVFFFFSCYFILLPATSPVFLWYSFSFVSPFLHFLTQLLYTLSPFHPPPLSFSSFLPLYQIRPCVCVFSSVLHLHGVVPPACRPFTSDLD